MGIKIRILRLVDFFPRINLLQVSGFQCVCFNAACFLQTILSGLLIQKEKKRRKKQRHCSSSWKELAPFLLCPDQRAPGPLHWGPVHWGPPAAAPTAAPDRVAAVVERCWCWALPSLTNSFQWGTQSDICFPIVDFRRLFLVKLQLVTDFKANHLSQPVILFLSWNWTFAFNSSFEFSSNATFVTTF